MADNTAWLIISKLYTLLTGEFTTADVYRTDLIRIPNYPDAGTFCIELVSGPTPAPEEAITESVWDNYVFNIFVYLRFVDKELGPEDLTQIVENTVAFLREWDQVQTDTWWKGEVIGVDYGIAEQVIGKSITYLRMAKIDWQCQVSHNYIIP